MTTKNATLVHRISDLVDANDELRKILDDYRDVLLRLAEHIEADESGVTALSRLDAPEERRTMTEGMEKFESARRQMRIALFSLCREQGASISEVGKLLGISRQLASRLAADAVEVETASA